MNKTIIALTAALLLVPLATLHTVGMLDIADTPYPELIRAVRKVGGEMYEVRHYDNDHAKRGSLR